MRELTSPFLRTGVSRKLHTACAGNFIAWLVLLCLVLLTGAARAADDREDEYLRVYTLVQQADTLKSEGQSTEALAKYQQAEKGFRTLQSKYPGWNSQVVSFRLNYVDERIKSLGAKAPTPAATAPAASQSEKASGVTSTGAVTGPNLKLLERGAEPRRVLRLHPKAGSKQSLEMSMQMAMQVKIGGMENQQTDLPAMKFAMDAAVQDVSAEGDISYQITMGEASIPEGAGVAPEVAETIKASFGGIKGLSGTGKLSSRGLDKGAQMNLPAGATPQMRQTADQMKDTFSRLAPQLPEEAVGVGARWEVHTPVRSQGMLLDQTALCELVSLEGDRMVTKSTISQQGGKQKIDSPAMPGLKVNLEKMSGKGGGQTSFDLAQLLPVEGTFDLESDMAMDLDVNGEKQPMTMKMVLKLHLQAK